MVENFKHSLFLVKIFLLLFFTLNLFSIGSESKFTSSESYTSEYDSLDVSGFGKLVMAVNGYNPLKGVSEIISEDPCSLFGFGSDSKTIYDYISIAERIDWLEFKRLLHIIFLCFDKQVDYLLNNSEDFSKQQYKRWQKILVGNRFFRKGSIRTYLKKKGFKRVVSSGNKLLTVDKFDSVIKNSKKL